MDFTVRLGSNQRTATFKKRVSVRKVLEQVRAYGLAIPQDLTTVTVRGNYNPTKKYELDDQAPNDDVLIIQISE